MGSDAYLSVGRPLRDGAVNGHHVDVQVCPALFREQGTARLGLAQGSEASELAAVPVALVVPLDEVHLVVSHQRTVVRATARAGHRFGATVSRVMEAAPLVADVLPRLAQEMIHELVALGETDLAGQISGLRVETPCSCGDDFCQSFSTGGHTAGKRYEGDHRTVPLLPDGVMVNVDVAEGVIVYVEILL